MHQFLAVFRGLMAAEADQPGLTTHNSLPARGVFKAHSSSSASFYESASFVVSNEGSVLGIADVSRYQCSNE